MPKPIKRHSALQPISREHHEGLLLSFKIREGIRLNIDPKRIKEYCSWFWKIHLTDHFEHEERYIFPVLSEQNPMVQQALQEHRELRDLFASDEKTIEHLKKIEESIVAHIRFEERILFNEIERIANSEELSLIESSHKPKNTPVWNDNFWQSDRKEQQ